MGNEISTEGYSAVSTLVSYTEYQRKSKTSPWYLIASTVDSERLVVNKFENVFYFLLKQHLETQRKCQVYKNA